jgi:hypothetical protein
MRGGGASASSAAQITSRAHFLVRVVTLGFERAGALALSLSQRRGQSGGSELIYLVVFPMEQRGLVDDSVASKVRPPHHQNSSHEQRRQTADFCLMRK